MESSSAPTNPEPRAGDELPAVEPPSTSFFVQLFVLPALIVFGIIIVWYLFGKLAGSHRSIEEYVAIIKSDRGDRWKAALDLSHLLNEQSAYTKDEALALQLTDELQKGLAQSSSDQQDAQYLEYLSGALGSFQIPTGVPALRAAIAPSQPLGVRKAALLALAKLADRLGDLRDPNVRADAQKTLKDEDPYLRGLSALLLGKLRDPAAAPALKAALSDPDATVRYNAACALAALGDDSSVAVLVEMLDAKGLSERFFFEDDDHKKHVDQPLVAATTVQAIRSIDRLMQTKPSANLAGVAPALEKLSADENPLLRNEAKGLLLKLSSTQKGKTP